MKNSISRRMLIVFLLLGFVSLTADIVYEGARSVSGSYLETVEAPAIAAAIVGAGDLIGYGMRFVSGVIASYIGSSAIYWGFTLAGYLLQFTLPLLAFTNWWIAVVAIYLIERIGKGLRTPTRDTILSEVVSGIGLGKGFGIHEVLDQLGAISGPLIVALALSYGGYGLAYIVLIVPAVISVSLVVAAWRLYPSIRAVGRRQRLTFRGLGKRFWFYTISMAFLSLGYIHWAIISYYLKHWAILSDVEIALSYMIAMATDAIIAFPIGFLYDIIKLRSLYIAPLLCISIPITLFLSTTNRILPYVLSAIWGIIMGVYETNMRAGVADIVEEKQRALAYGVFGLIYGVSWTIGGFIITPLINLGIYITTIYVIAVEIISIILLYLAESWCR
ncbi:major facilitator superfamily MFS_1 [Ignisphaera aggregans DSM 17230]|uniref:Major facilitator superfamily MFS_1 n=1 Tax=Ignisphaera aggregans (strain DSM 17230 / JCM 13409 / AQ1.S1) TaxID=583356 RepID=E0SPC8_IGNAA|nr:major facilitator superfamily MFS_1 [Ignisphaera aggregans DSM 17230]